MLSLAMILAAAWSASGGPAAPIRLQALTATSGTGASALLDGSADAGWSPEADPIDEGILFRFEQPTRVDAIQVAPCGGQFTLVAFVNGRRDDRPLTFGTTARDLPLARGTRLHSLFLEISAAQGRPCLRSVAFRAGGAKVAVLPPRKVPGRVQASSTLAPAAAYHPSYLFDGRLDFGWVEGAPGPGEGESVTVELDQPLAISALEVWNGYQRSPVHFQKNARARKLAVSLDGAAPIVFDLKDAQGAQKLSLPGPTTARKVRIAVSAAYPGTKYPDLVLSELRFWDAEGPVGVETPDRAELRRTLEAAVQRTPLAAILGQHLSNTCDFEPDVRRTMKLRPDHTFVVYEAACAADGGCTSEVLDGTWVLAAQQAPWAEIEIYGRRHRVDEVWDPYGENGHRVKETDRIAGGRIRFARMADLSAAERGALSGVETGGGGSFDTCTATSARNPLVARGPPLTDVFIDGR